MFRHLNPFYLDSLQEASIGVESHWDHHVAIKNPIHHDNMSRKHFDLSDKHGRIAAGHDEKAQECLERAQRLTTHSPMASKEAMVRKHMAAATEHMLKCHDHACREDYHQSMGEAHAEYRDHLTGMPRASEKKAHAHHERAAKVLDGEI